jgi:hypothetical protein
LAEEKTGFSRRNNDKHNGEQRHPGIKILTSQFEYIFTLTHGIGSAGIIYALDSLTYSEAEPGEETRTQYDQHYGVVQLPQHGKSPTGDRAPDLRPYIPPLRSGTRAFSTP